MDGLSFTELSLFVAGASAAAFVTGLAGFAFAMNPIYAADIRVDRHPARRFEDALHAVTGSQDQEIDHVTGVALLIALIATIASLAMTAATVWGTVETIDWIDPAQPNQQGH